MMIGNGTVFCEALQAGARGGILAVGCAVPRLCIEIYQAVRAGDLIRSETLQYRLTPLALAVTKTYGVGGLKTAMGMAGLIGGAVRAPLKIPGETAVAEIAELLNQAQHALDPNSSGAATGVAPGSSLVHQGADG